MLSQRRLVSFPSTMAKLRRRTVYSGVSSVCACGVIMVIDHTPWIDTVTLQVRFPSYIQNFEAEYTCCNMSMMKPV